MVGGVTTGGVTTGGVTTGGVTTGGVTGGWKMARHLAAKLDSQVAVLVGVADVVATFSEAVETTA